jgi:hypothetical protein
VTSNRELIIIILQLSTRGAKTNNKLTISRREEQERMKMSTLHHAIGDRQRYFRRAWKIREPGRYGYITLESENDNTYFVFYLLLGRVWNRLPFKIDAGVADIYQPASSGTVVEVAMEEGSLRPRLILLVEVEGRTRWWFIYYWRPFGGRVLLSSVATTLDPYIAYI